MRKEAAPLPNAKTILKTAHEPGLFLVLKVQTDFLNRFWLLGPGGRFTSETAARRFKKWNGRCVTVSEVKRLQIQNGCVKRPFPNGHRRCSRARVSLGDTGQADAFNCVAGTGPRLANVTGEARLSLTDFLPEV